MPRASKGSQAPSDWRQAARVCWAIFVLSLVAYGATMSASVGGGDSGELVVDAATLGVPHPPGYPLYTLWAHAFTYWPWGSIAARVNAASVVFQAAANALLALTIYLYSGSVGAALLTALLFGGMPATWRYATHAEVFALANVFTAGVLALLALHVVWPPTRDRRRLLAAAALWTGLSFCNHHTAVFVAGPFWLCLLLTCASLRSPKRLAVCAAWFFVGLLPYAYLPLASLRPQVWSWGDQTSWDGFWTHLLRREYGTFELSVVGNTQEGQFWRRLGLHLGALLRDSWGLVPLAALLGARNMWVRKEQTKRAFVLTVFVAWLSYVLVIMGLSRLDVRIPLQIGVQSRLWMTANLLVCALAGVGLARVLGTLASGRRQRVVAAALGALVGASFLWHGVQRWRENVPIFADFARAMLEVMPRDALILTTGEEVYNPTRYLQTQEGVRPDIRSIDTNMMQTTWYERAVRRAYPDVVYPGRRREVPGVLKGFTLTQLIEANLPRRDVFLCNSLNEPEAAVRDNFDLQAYGFCMHVVPKRGESDLDTTWTTASRAALALLQPYDAMDFDPTSWEAHVHDLLLTAQRLFAGRIINYGARHNATALVREAATLLESVRRREPVPDRTTLRSLGVAYNYLSATDPSAHANMIEAWRAYLELAPTNDTGLEVIRNAVNNRD